MEKTRLVLLPAFLIILLFVAAAPALAHANLVRSDPPANSAQKTPPTRVRLWFSEAVEPSFSSVSVLDSSGASVDKHDSHRASDDPTALEVSLNPLAPGLYTVVWKSLSAVDGHITNGSFAFTVGDTPLTQAVPRDLMSQVDATLAANTFPPLAQVIIRWLNIIALALLVGALAFPILVLPLPTSRRRAFVRTAFVLAALASIALLVMQAFIAGGGIGALGSVLLGTRFGTVWIFRALLLTALGILLFVVNRGTERARLVIAFGLGAALLFTQSFTSHDAAVANPPLLPLLTDFIHLLGVAIWVGGLAQLLFVAPAYLSSLAEDEQPRVLSSLLTRFSLVALIMVAIIGATGAYSMYLQVGSLEALFNTLYGTALLVKLLLIFFLLGIAGLNLIVMRPASGKIAAARVRAFARRFDIAVGAEIILAFAVLLVVGVMTSTEPAQSAYNASPNLRIETHQADDLNITLGIAPAVVGANDFDIKVRDASGQPVSNATVVRLLTSMREMDMGTQELAATNQGNGHYTLHADVASMVGTWNLQVLVRRAGVDDVRTTFEFFALAQPAAPPPPLILSSTEAQIGLGLTLLALVVGAASAIVLKSRWRRLANMGAAVVIGLIGTFAVLEATANGPALPGVIVPVAPASARLLHSPIAPTPNQIAAGQQIYQQNCAVCHGARGKGDGPAAANLNPKPFDLTVHAPMHTEGELYWWVTNGITGTAMPVWGNRLSDLQRWQVVTFVKTFGANATPTPPPAASFSFTAQPAPDVKVSLAITGNKDLDAQVNVPAHVIFEFTALDTNEDITRVDAASANGHYTASGNYLDAPGMWRIRVIVQQTGQTDAVATFPFYIAGKNDTNDPRAVDWLKQSDAAMNALKSLRATEQLNDGNGGGAVTDYEFQAPDRMRYQVRGGTESIAVGKQQFYRDGNTWSARPRVDGYVFPNFTNGTDAKSAMLGRTETLNGIPTQIVESVDANGIRYAFWIGTNDHRIYQYAMIGPGHYMMEYYAAFDGAVTIQAPGSPVVLKQQVEGVYIVLTATPLPADVSGFDVALSDANGRPVDDAARVMLLTALTAPTQPAYSLDTANVGNGHYSISGPWLDKGGKWQIGVVVQLADQTLHTAVFPLDVPSIPAATDSIPIEDSPSPMHPINVTVYDSTVTVNRTDLPPGQIVRVTAMRIAPSRNDCGGRIAVPQLGLSAPFSAAGIAELKFIAPYWGELHAVCGKDGLIITL